MPGMCCILTLNVPLRNNASVSNLAVNVQMKLCNFKIAQNTRLSNSETVEIYFNHFHHHHTRVSPAILSPYLATIARESASTSPAGMNFPELTNLWKNSDYLRGILDFASQFDPN